MPDKKQGGAIMARQITFETPNEQEVFDEEVIFERLFQKLREKLKKISFYVIDEHFPRLENIKLMVGGYSKVVPESVALISLGNATEETEDRVVVNQIGFFKMCTMMMETRLSSENIYKIIDGDKDILVLKELVSSNLSLHKKDATFICSLRVS